MRRGTRHAVAMCFDLDGVLWDSSPVHASAFDVICRNEGLQGLSYDRLAGLTTRDAWALVLEANHRPLREPTIERLTAEKRSLARQSLIARPPINAEIHALGSLGTTGCRTALVTGASRQTAEIFLHAVSSIHTFDVVVTAESAARGKPAADPYLLAMTLLGTEPAECWALEDSDSGIESAHCAGARVVHLSRVLPCGNPHARTETCLTSLSEFVAMVHGDVGTASCQRRS